MKKQILSVAVIASLGAIASLSAQAATLNDGDVLRISSAILDGFTGYVIGGSYYAIDGNGNNAISAAEKIPLSEGTTGLVIGAITTPGATHSGPPTASDTNQITAPDYAYGNTGSWYSTIPITGSTTAGLNMSGWNWPWAGIPGIPLGGGAWQPGPINCLALGCTGYTFTDGIGRLQWDGVYGHTYKLDFASTVPLGDPSGFGGVHFYTHLEGTVLPVPVPASVPLPAAFWLFGSGLLGLMGASRWKKKLAPI